MATAGAGWVSRSVVAPWVWVGLLVTAVIVGSGCDQTSSARTSPKSPSRTADSATEAARPVPVKVVHPIRGPWKRTTTHPAHVEPYEQADIYAKASGYLRTMHVDIGDRVYEGQVLAELWVPEYDTELAQKRAMVDQAEAEKSQAGTAVKVALAALASAEARIPETRAVIRRAEADQTLWRIKYDRSQKLVNRAAETQSELDESRSQFLKAEATVAEAQAQLRSAETAVLEARARTEQARSALATFVARLAVAQSALEHHQALMQYTRIKAPFVGVVARRSADTGAFVQSAATRDPDPILTLARVDRKRIVFDIPESEAALVKVGQPATFHAHSLGGGVIHGQVTRFADVLEPSTRTMRTEVELDGRVGNLRPGSYGSVTITLADHPEALLLPTIALLTTGDKPTVLVAEDGYARRREIGAAFDDGIQVQVTAGLKGSEQVIIEGQNSVRDGQAVEIAD